MKKLKYIFLIGLLVSFTYSCTLDEVIDHYSEGLQNSSTIDPLMKKVNQGGVQLTDQQKEDLKAFLLTLSDPSFLNNPNFLNQ